MDILIGKLIKILPQEDIYLSCEDEKYKSVVDNWEINFVLRDKILAFGNVSNVELISNICGCVPGSGDILWCTCVEPFFNEYAEILRCWQDIDKNEYDSLNVVYPMKKFMLDQFHNPIGFGFGHWHKYSQTIRPLYQISWATAVLSRECINNVSYLVGQNPYWYDSYSPIIDIDTLEDFNFASLAYKALMEQNPEKRG
jgi:N-acylneuraminate cytidylyltransferase